MQHTANQQRTMKATDKIVVYVAENNLQAHLLANLLDNAGIEAFAVEDNSTVGVYSLGTVDELHRPKVYVDQKDVVAARAFIERFEAGEISDEVAEQPYCYHCGATCKPGQTKCSECGATLDAHREEDTRRQQSEEPAKLTGLRRLQRPIAFVFIALLVIPVLGQMLVLFLRAVFRR